MVAPSSATIQKPLPLHRDRRKALPDDYQVVWRAFLCLIRNSLFVPQVEQAFSFAGFHRFDHSLSTGAGEWDCTNADHRPVICFHVERMRWR
jgi:hypothetical protein